MTRTPRILLAIETSCDETAVAILKDGKTLLANELSSQVEVHARFGGVVPEIASRQHLAALFPMIDRALEKAGISLADIDAVAVTRAPGLIGALLVGVSAAKSLAYALGVPLVPVNHLEAHLLAALLLDPAPAFPFLGQIVSGGHTALYAVQGPGLYELLGSTRDDAAGEAYDKVAKMLGLGYPGGVVIDRLAATGNPKAIDFPRAMKQKSTLDFSFSGLKTAVRLHLETHPPTEADLPDLCASFQEAVVDSLVHKALQALKQTGFTRWVMGGGVAANSRLREVAAQTAKRRRLELYLPTRAMCTDNAAMVAVAGWERLRAGAVGDLTLNAAANEAIF